MLKIIDDFDLKGLEEFGFEISFIEHLGYSVAHRNKEGNQCFYRLSVNDKMRVFRKVKYHLKKVSLEMKVMPSDVKDLIQAGIVEKI